MQAARGSKCCGLKQFHAQDESQEMAVNSTAECSKVKPAFCQKPVIPRSACGLHRSSDISHSPTRFSHELETICTTPGRMYEGSAPANAAWDWSVLPCITLSVERLLQVKLYSTMRFPRQLCMVQALHLIESQAGISWSPGQDHLVLRKCTAASDLHRHSQTGCST